MPTVYEILPSDISCNVCELLLYGFRHLVIFLKEMGEAGINLFRGVYCKAVFCVQKKKRGSCRSVKHNPF